MTFTTRYRDVGWPDARCEHMNATRGEEVALERWEKMRGNSVTIDADDFVKGLCVGCDSFGILPDRTFVATRQSLELGD